MKCSVIGINIKYNIAYLVIFLSSMENKVISVTHNARLIQKNEDFKYICKRMLSENSHLIIVCPELEKESLVKWYKDNEILNSSFRNNMGSGEEEPHLTIDAYNSLYILHATKREEGTYTCIVDGHNMQKSVVIIVSKSRFLNEDFIRFSIYLSFVLSLTLSCYCAGICLAWHRRASFADPLNLYNHSTKLNLNR
ncbi:uncharacterized protein LOC128198036 [Bicyclus anynana]|uniref:Uncharacterized protein LOC128198036 n=1 Tax=Bicyclus anynana TaxID=110368 RepID=A0ABM3LFZ4_BICAN|nr:uncharacterized protein LOC128198036 [Bicyclus anynana]